MLRQAAQKICILCAALCAAQVSAPARAKAVEALRLPLAFERNEGQSDPEVKFLARGPGYRIYLSTREAIASFEGGRSVIRLQFQGASEAPMIYASEPFAHRTHYFVGDDPSAHVTGVASFARVVYGSVYPGIDLVYRGDGGLFEYDFIVAPHADPRRIRLRLAGTQGQRLSAAGDLVLATAIGDITFRKPVAFQEQDGGRRFVDAAYDIAESGEIGFALGAYDPARPLVIDPILAYSSFLWGGASDVTLDAQGYLYVAGITSHADLPSADGYQTSVKGTLDAFVLKLNPAGTQVVYATYLGGRRGRTFSKAIAVDGSGNAYLTGTTESSGFPTTRGAYQRTFAEGSSFVTKFSADGGTLLYSTYVNGARLESIAVDAAGSVYVAGAPSVTSAFATTPGAFQQTPSGGVVLRLDAAGSAAVFATRLGGTGDVCRDVALDPAGNVVLTGTTSSSSFPTRNAVQSTLKGSKDAFLARLDASGATLVQATYLGGSEKDFGTAVALDSAGDAYVVGRSFSNDFPTTFAAFQPAKAHSDPIISNAFIAKIPAAGGSLAYASYLGGRWCLTSGVYSCFAFGSSDEGVDGATAVAVDGAGYAYVGGYANSVEFPKVDAIHGNFGMLGENERAPFVAKVNPGGDRLVYSVVLGTRAVGPTLYGLAVDAAGVAHAVGSGCCPGTDLFPFTAGMPLNDTRTSGSFLVRLASGRYPTTVSTSSARVVSGAPVSLRAEVRSASAGGSVTFTDGATPLGSAPVANGTAVLTVTLPPGAHQIRAVNSSDGVVSPPAYLLVTTP